MKIQFIRWIAIMVSILALAACASLSGGSAEGESVAGGKAEFDTMYTKVAIKLKQLSDAGGAWAYTGDTLNDAHKLAEQQNYGKAILLVKQAMAETEIATQQLESQKDAGPYLF